MRFSKPAVLVASLAFCLPMFAQPLTATLSETPRLSALQKMPIRELTVFKDGHAFVLHEGTMPTDNSGNVLLDYLPTPIIGTFWAYASTPGARLNSVTASPRRMLVERTALNLRELLEANVGASVVVKENNDVPKYAATILSIPQRSSSELEITGVSPTPSTPAYDPYGRALPPVDAGKPLPQKGDIILLQTDDGTKVLPITQIRDVVFKNAPRGKTDNEEWRNLLTLKLNWNGARQGEANVGLMYLQKGVRWIPSYRITLGDKGTARVELQATLINELTDLQNATMHLVIGVPSFAFKDTPDPISLQNTFAQLSQYFQAGARGAMSNAIMSQSARMGEYSVARDEAAPTNIGPEIAGSGKNEDLFVFTVKNVTLKKGERMVMPVAEYSLPYRDVFALNLPFAPPAEAMGNWNSEQQRQIATLLSSPKVQHKIRLTNKSNQPLTTAPALIIKDGQVLAQGMMTYTASGGEGDVDVTSTVDVRITKTDVETTRTPNAEKWQGYTYGRIDLRGKIELCSYRKEAMDIEVTRYVLGIADAADKGAKIEKLNVFEDTGFMPGGDYPDWWRWGGDWGSWWSHFNGVGRIKWTTHLEPQKEVQLNYTWHYFWRG
jgi:hypothetical protein